MKSDPISLLISLGAGIIVGVIYSLVRIPSPAPPLFALLGLFGILVGSQLIPTVQKHFAASPVHAAKQFAESQGQHSPAIPAGQSGDPSTTAPRPPTTRTKS